MSCCRQWIQNYSEKHPSQLSVNCKHLGANDMIAWTLEAASTSDRDNALVNSPTLDLPNPNKPLSAISKG